MFRTRRRRIIAAVVLMVLAADLGARPVYGKPLWGSTKRYSKWVAGVGLNVVRVGIAGAWWRKAISWGTAKAALLVTTAATGGTLIGQGINYGISRRWDPEPIYPTGGDPIFTSITDAEVDAMIPELFEFAGWTDDPNTHFPFTVDDILLADVDLYPGIGTAALNYVRASVRLFVDASQGAAVFWAEGHSQQFYLAKDAIELDIVELQLATEEFARLISETTVETTEGILPLESTATEEGLVIGGLPLMDFEHWFVELETEGVDALPDTEPALVAYLQEVARVAQPEPIGEDIVAWALADPDDRQLEYDAFGPDEFQSFSDMLFTSIDTYWSRIDLEGSALVCPADIDGDGDIDLVDLSVLLAHYGMTSGVSFEEGDLDADGDVDLTDLSALLAAYGSTCGWALWADSFDYYAVGSGMHGQGRWKGWDNDPAWDAVVTDAQARSVPHSVDIKDDADLVHEFFGADSGTWTFTARQYIPSDFSSNGGGQFAGTYFVMLNTYNDGGPHENSDWSVQMQFDSNDGMLKVYYGDGVNTIEVPYVTDRWVKIQAVIDLDEDWTQIYYDDELVAEYSWTGGVLGGGGGALNIGAVDLYANGSTSVYHDDLALRPGPP
ncbi:MAG: hypothetical protein ACE5I3_09525 [Phycisphaerae bacterium]